MNSEFDPLMTCQGCYARVRASVAEHHRCDPSGKFAKEELIDEIKKTRMHLRRVLDAVHNDTGAEPSVSVLGRACDEAEQLFMEDSK